MAGDTLNGDAVHDHGLAEDSDAGLLRLRCTCMTTEIVGANDESGQVIFTGNDYVAVRSYSGAGNDNDGLCIYSLAKCYNFAGARKMPAEGVAISGGKHLWVAESATGVFCTFR